MKGAIDLTTKNNLIELEVKDGFVRCPTCRAFIHETKFTPDAVASKVILRCRKCKNTIAVEFVDGKAYKARTIQGQCP